MQINFTNDINKTSVRNTIDLIDRVKETFESQPFPGEKGFRFLQDYSEEDYHVITVFISNGEWYASICRWCKWDDFINHLDDPVRRALLRGVFSPLLIQKEIIFDQEEKESLGEFIENLLLEPQEQTFERRGVIMKGGTYYVLQLFEEGKMKQVFRWDSAEIVKGAIEQVMKFASKKR